MKTEMNICDLCYGKYPAERLTEVGGQVLCPDCLEEHTVVCRECEERILREDNAGTDNLPLCQDCYDDRYATCSRCGVIIRQDRACYHSSDEDEETPYCGSCFAALRQDGINDYSYKPVPIFYGAGPRYFGVELEIDGAGEDSGNANDLMSIANRRQELIYCKHDGSLADGFEIVTHPMSLEFHQNDMPWAEVMREAVSMGYTSHQAGTCGLHVHVNRDAFGNAEGLQDVRIARILYFFEKNWEELLKFSRRTQGQLNQWAARYGYKDQPREILDHAKKGGEGGRYSCVNLQNRDTIEFRMFRGTLKYNTLIATLQLVDRVCEVALNLSDAQIKELSWTTFVAGCHAPELVRYLKEQRLYVNELVKGEAEV